MSSFSLLSTTIPCICASTIPTARISRRAPWVNSGPTLRARNSAPRITRRRRMCWKMPPSWWRGRVVRSQRRWRRRSRPRPRSPCGAGVAQAAQRPDDAANASADLHTGSAARDSPHRQRRVGARRPLWLRLRRRRLRRLLWFLGRFELRRRVLFQLHDLGRERLDVALHARHRLLHGRGQLGNHGLSGLGAVELQHPIHFVLSERVAVHLDHHGLEARPVQLLLHQRSDIVPEGLHDLLLLRGRLLSRKGLLHRGAHRAVDLCHVGLEKLAAVHDLEQLPDRCFRGFGVLRQCRLTREHGEHNSYDEFHVIAPQSPTRMTNASTSAARSCLRTLLSSSRLLIGPMRTRCQTSASTATRCTLALTPCSASCTRTRSASASLRYEPACRTYTPGRSIFAAAGGSRLTSLSFSGTTTSKFGSIW